MDGLGREENEMNSFGSGETESFVRPRFAAMGI